MKVRNKVEYIKLFLKGVFMGIADAVPGVSGGTIALLLGIYEELISTVSGLNFGLIIDLKQNGFKSFWNKLNGNFLITLILGIGISLVSFIKISAGLLENYPLYVWSFFLGLILSTIYIIFKLIDSWNLINIFSAFFMIILSVLITSNPISGTENISLLHILVSGIIAASAMILPGISGSLILVILGVYKTLIDALDNLEIEIISSFLIGAIIGLLSFSKILKWLFNNYKNLAYSIMLGLVIGSIEKIWPWKSENIIEITNSEISLSIVLTLTGVLLILVVEKYNKN